MARSSGRIAVLIDGGYLAKVLKKRFHEKRIDYRLLVNWVCMNDAIHRTYFYDCLPHQSSQPTDEERRIYSSKKRFLDGLNKLDRFMVRLGRLEYRGINDKGLPVFEQMRVDLMIGLDIASLVLRDRVDTIAVVSGDSDLIPAVELA